MVVKLLLALIFLVSVEANNCGDWGDKEGCSSACNCAWSWSNATCIYKHRVSDSECSSDLSLIVGLPIAGFILCIIAVALFLPCYFELRNSCRKPTPLEVWSDDEFEVRI